MAFDTSCALVRIDSIINLAEKSNGKYDERLLELKENLLEYKYYYKKCYDIASQNCIESYLDAINQFIMYYCQMSQSEQYQNICNLVSFYRNSENEFVNYWHLGNSEYNISELVESLNVLRKPNISKEIITSVSGKLEWAFEDIQDGLLNKKIDIKNTILKYHDAHYSEDFSIIEKRDYAKSLREAKPKEVFKELKNYIDYNEKLNFLMLDFISLVCANIHSQVDLLSQAINNNN